MKTKKEIKQWLKNATELRDEAQTKANEAKDNITWDEHDREKQRLSTIIDVLQSILQ